MSALKQYEITFFSTGAQSKNLSKSDWYSSDKILLTSEKEFEKLSDFQFYKNHPVFVATSERSFLKFLNYFIQNVIGSDLFSKFYKSSPVLIDFTEEITQKYHDVLRDIFPTIISAKGSDIITLEQGQMMTVLSKSIETRMIRAIALHVFKDLGIIKIMRGDFSSLIVRIDTLTPSGKGCIPDFDDVEIIDYGNAIRFGNFESSMRGLLYENDKDYRLERKKQRLSSEKSFGACLRRLRIQKKLKQIDFKNTSEKTIRRIEDGDVPTATTKAKILNELGLTEEELLSY